jgi:hypothetical protein
MPALYVALGFSIGFFVALLVVFLTRSAACSEMDKILDHESENQPDTKSSKSSDNSDILQEIITAFDSGC